MAPDLSQTLTARFLAATTPARTKRKKKPEPQPVENEEFLAMFWRMVRAFERRMIDDPTLLPQADQLRERLAQAVNVAIYANSERYNVDPRFGASQAECGRILNGISKQAASQRGQRGKALMLARQAAAGAIPFADAREEKRIIVATASEAVTILADYRARKAA